MDHTGQIEGRARGSSTILIYDGTTRNFDKMAAWYARNSSKSAVEDETSPEEQGIAANTSRVAIKYHPRQLSVTVPSRSIDE